MLRGIELVAEGGRTTALVGRSGAGKSTIMSLALRYWDAQTGNILIDGQDIAHVSRRSLRQAVSYVNARRSSSHIGSPPSVVQTRFASSKAAAWSSAAVMTS